MNEAAHEQYANACMREIAAALAAGRIVKGWQYGAHLRIRDVKRAPADSEFWYSGTTFSGMAFHFSVYSIEDAKVNERPVHREDEFEHHMSRCGRWTRDMDKERVTTDWAKVTCKVCLKSRPDRAS